MREMPVEIYEYDDVDPLGVLHLNLLCLDFALTPERVAAMRRLDPRPLPCFGVYVKEEGQVAGQVGVFRLPAVSMEGVDEVGGVWAVSTHPAFEQQGICTHLLEEAHARMRRAGLRYSTLGTQRYRGAYRLYRRLGYEDVFYSSSAIGKPAARAKRSGLRAERAGSDRLCFADQLFEQIAAGRLGFARRHIPFFLTLHQVEGPIAQNLWLLWQGSEATGYALAFQSGSLLRIKNLLLFDGVDPVSAAAAIADEVGAQYVWVRLDRPADMAHFRRAGFQTAQPDWSVFMVKPLAREGAVDQFRQLYGADTGRFLLSYMDVT